MCTLVSDSGATAPRPFKPKISAKVLTLTTLKSDHVPEFLFELRVIRVFEGLHSRCGFKSFFDQMRCARRDAGVTAHRSNAPAGLAFRRPRRLGNDTRHLRVRDRSLATAP